MRLFIAKIFKKSYKIIEYCFNVLKIKRLSLGLGYRIYALLSKFKKKGLYQKALTILIKNKELMGQGEKKRAFLCATGPSIKQENLALLAGEDVYSVSNFFLHSDIKIINPKMHFFAPYHKPLVPENYIQWLQKADLELPKETSICLSYATREWVLQYKIFSERTVYYQFMADDSIVAGNLCDIVRPVMFPQTGPLMIFPVLLYMGYEEIYLLGCDHTVLRNYGAPVEHFYKQADDMRVNVVSQWDPIESTLKDELRMFLQYKFYNSEALRLGVKIINLSTDSWLSYFPFDRLDRVIKNNVNLG